MSKRKTVLVLGCNTSRDYAIIYSLGRSGVDVTVSREMNQESPYLHSRYISSSIVLPDKTDSSAWVEELSRHLDTNKYDLIIPPDDYTTNNLCNAASIQDKGHFSIPSKESWRQVYDKDLTYKLAQAADIPLPKNITINNLHQMETINFSSWNFPLVIKPISSKVKTNTGYQWIKHDHIYRIDELFKKTIEYLNYGSVSIQEFIRGVGLGQGFLADKGEILYGFEWHRVHEPPKGGASTYRVSAPVNPEILKYSRALIEKLKWSGVAMVEYRYDNVTKEFWLMEVNGRFWGSLSLAIAAGADFPEMLYQLQVNNKRPGKNWDYREGIYCRNTASDIYWFLNNRKQKKSDSEYLNIKSKKELFSEFKNILSLRERYDDFYLSDPLPAFIILYNLVSSVARKIIRKIVLKTTLLLSSSWLWQLFNGIRLRIVSKFSSDKEILFVCFGNICRSIYAERCWKQKLSEPGLNWVVDSAGYSDATDKYPPPEALSASGEFGVSLDNHTPKKITKDDIKRTSIIFCMDMKNLEYLISQSPQSFYKIFLLGAFGSDKKIITDPYGCDVDAFISCYSLINKSLHNIYRYISS